MSKKTSGLDRRKFVKTGLQVAGAAALAGGAKPGAASEEKKISDGGSIPAREFGSTGLEPEDRPIAFKGLVPLHRAE